MTEKVPERTSETERSIVDRTSDIVQTYLSRADIDADRIPELIERIGEALRKVGGGGSAVASAPASGAAEVATATPATAEATTQPAAGQAKGSGTSEDSRPEWMPEATIGPQRPPWDPAVPIEESYDDNYIYCLEDGRRMQMLKRHLKTRYNMSEEQYRRKWGLPDSYPMTAKNYRLMRRKLAKRTGFQPMQNQAERAQPAAASEAAPAQAAATHKKTTAKGSGGKTAQTKATQAKSGQAKTTQAKAGGKATQAKTEFGDTKSTTAKAASGKSGATKSSGGGKSSSSGGKPGGRKAV